MNFAVFLKGCISFMWPLFLRECFLVELFNILESSLIRMLNLVLRFKVQSRVTGPPRDPKKFLKWYKFEKPKWLFRYFYKTDWSRWCTKVSGLIFSSIWKMMVKKLKLSGHWRSNKGQNVRFSLKIQILMKRFW